MFNFLCSILLLASFACAQAVHVTNQAGSDRFAGWVRRGIDWEPRQRAGAVDGRPFVVGRELGLGSRVLDVYVELEAGEAATLDFERSVDAKAPTGAFTPPRPSLAGMPFLVRSATADGAGLDVHWRTRVGELVVDLWCVIYPGQTWCQGELQITANGPSRVAEVPPGFVLAGGDGFAACVLDGVDGDEILPAGTMIAAGQGYPTLPVVFTLVDSDQQPASAAANLAIGAVGVQSVWPLGNPSWLASRGSPEQWTSSNYSRVRSRLHGWTADSLGILANAQSTGGEGDQVFVGAECGLGMQSAGAELVNLMVAYGYARRPGKWREANGDGLTLDHRGLAMFEGYPFARGGSQDGLGLSTIPNRIDTHGWAEWREHSFRNRLFVAYRLTGSLALQWQIDQFARQFIYECTVDPRFTTSNYTGALRGYGWEALTCWWLQQTLEDRKLAVAVRERWLDRWRLLGLPRYGSGEYWDVRRDDRLGPGQQWLAYQQAAAVMFIDMAGQACNAQDVRDAALRGAKAVLEHAFAHDGRRWVGYSYVQIVDGAAAALPDGGTFGPGIESWMVGAAVVVARHDHANEQARAIVNQHVAENNVNGQWIAPDVIK